MPPAGSERAASAQGREFLRASFKVGSVHGRASYGFGERVFHHTDVPERARAARADVMSRLKGRPPTAGPRQAEWRPETRLGRSQGRRTPLAGESWEDRSLARANTEDRAREARERHARRLRRSRRSARRRREAESGRGGAFAAAAAAAAADDESDTDGYASDPDNGRGEGDGDWDPSGKLRGRPAWSTSVAFDPRGGAPLRRVRAPLPKKYVTPARRHANTVRKQREEKRRARAGRPFEGARTLAHNTFHLVDGRWHDYPPDVMALQYSQKLHSRDREAIREQVEGTYTPERLAAFLESAEKADDDVLDHRKARPVAAERERVAKKHMSDILHSAMGQGDGPRRVIRRKVYSHPGRWEASRLEEGVEAWSCCYSYTHDSRGCQFDGTQAEA